MMPKPTAILFLFIGPLLLNGCQSRPPTMDDQGAKVDRSADTVKGADIFPLEKGERRFEWREGNRSLGEPREVTVTLEQKEGLWHARIGDMTETVYRRKDDGSTWIEREFDYRENARVIYEPGLLSIPAKMTVDQTVEGKADITILNHKTGGRREHGTCEYTITLVGRVEVETPSGKIDAWRLKLTRKLNLQLATVDATIHLDLSPEHGMVQWEIVRQVRMLGLIPMNRTERLLWLGRADNAKEAAGKTEPAR